MGCHLWRGAHVPLQARALMSGAESKGNNKCNMLSLKCMDEQAADSRSLSMNDATVYVVDDDDSVRRSLKRLFRSRGWEVEVFASAASLLERAPLSGPGCILLDVQMPGINGLELQDRLAESGIFLPVVFLSGKGSIPMSVRAMKHGAVDFLVKPVAEDVLFQALDQAIRRYVAETGTRHNRESIMARLARLSEREREVLEQVLRGRLNKQIAFDMGIAEKTVKVHRGRVMEKMEAGSLADLVHMCDAAGIEFPQNAS
jgi:FixJ family two-component response regulator